MSAELKRTLSTAGQVLRATHLSAGYDGRAIVHDVNLEARPGKVVSIVGPNGSGKSTLLKSLAGVVPILGGQVLLPPRRWPRSASATFLRLTTSSRPSR